MTNKELLYLEDTLNSNMLLQTKCKNYTNQMQDRELKAYVKELEVRCHDIFSQVYKVFQ
jgi:hypothetical protein